MRQKQPQVMRQKQLQVMRQKQVTRQLSPARELLERHSSQQLNMTAGNATKAGNTTGANMTKGSRQRNFNNHDVSLVKPSGAVLRASAI